MPPTRQEAIVAIIALAVLASGVGIATYPNTAAAQGTQLTVKATTTQTDAPAEAMAYGEQPIELHFDWSGLGSGTHDMRLVENDPTGFDDTMREFTVEGDSGTKTFQLSPQELAKHAKESDREGAASLQVRWGEEAESNIENVRWTDTTVYTKGYDDLPDEVDHGEEVTVEYYGYTNQQQAHVRYVEDDRPHDKTTGDDTQIRRHEVSGPGYFEGTFTFTPSDYVEGDDRELEVQARPDQGWLSDIVRTITVAEPETNIDARITDLSPPSGEYHAGQDVPAEVSVENTGNARHTFFVGYGVVDENGNTHDNDGSTGTQVNLGPGETDTVTVSWTVEEDAPTGTYGVGASVWQESNPQNLDTRLDDTRQQNAFEVVAAPDTPTNTESEDAASEPSEETEDSTNDASGDSDSSNDNDPGGDAGAEVGDEVDDADTDEDGPGLGSLTAITALAAAALLARHRGG